ncbi:cation:proton antiporter [Paenibacillus sp. HJGM_3]|uniref:cation:proton antiporter n=1 Tax=Paenibacillus sp. HJGM_3 TaxID=3379816 RepID=UPI0038591B3D
MELFLGVLLLLVLIGMSNVLNRFLPFISVPLFQIALGAAAAMFELGTHMPLNPELFLVLFVAPLLYNDGKRIPREELWVLRAPILLLALGLVFATVLVGGLVIHALIPTIPLPAAFALAAILSPTDAVAVSALSGRIKLPKYVLRLLEGEALMNDASGLVAFKFAVAATVTGTFSLFTASYTFILIALGGLVVGTIVAWLLIWIRVFLRRFGMEDVTVHMLIQIVTPFLLYLAAEELGMSGILAVVAGGIVHAIARDRTESSMAQLKIVSNSTWTVILFILNGLVFVLLGLQIPEVLAVIIEEPSISNWQVLLYIILISGTLILLRFIWIYSFWRGAYKWTTPQSEAGASEITPSTLRGPRRNSTFPSMLPKPSLIDSVLTSLSGVRGAVTLAAAFSIPYVLQDGSPFPERDLILFLAAGVILFTLLLASFVLPLVTGREPDGAEEGPNTSTQAARVAIMQAAIRAVEEEINDDNKTASLSVIADYNRMMQRQLRQDLEQQEGSHLSEMEARIRLMALAAERKEVARLLEIEDITEETAGALYKMIDQLEAALSSRFNLKLYQLRARMARITARFLAPFFHRGRPHTLPQDLSVLKETKMKTSQAAIEAVRKQIQASNQYACQAVIGSYTEIIDRLNIGFRQTPTDKHFRQQKKEIRLKAIQAERNEVQAQFEQGAISRETANQLRRSIHYSEASMLEAMELS